MEGILYRENHEDPAELNRNSRRAIHVTQEAGTECAFTGEYWRHLKDPGMYHCVVCGAPLFDSKRSLIRVQGGRASPSPQGGGA